MATYEAEFNLLQEVWVVRNGSEPERATVLAVEFVAVGRHRLTFYTLSVGAAGDQMRVTNQIVSRIFATEQEARQYAHTWPQP